MQIDDRLRDELLEYLVKKPWHEVNGLITRLAAQGRVDKPKPAEPATLKEGGN